MILPKIFYSFKSVRDGSFKVENSEYVLADPSAWVWETSSLIADGDVTSRLIAIDNTSPSVDAIISVAFNDYAFFGKVFDAIVTPPEVPFSNGINYQAGAKEYTALLTNNVVTTFVDVDSTASNVTIKIPANKTVLVKYTLNLPSFLPATTYSQSFTVTDITEYLQTPQIIL